MKKLPIGIQTFAKIRDDDYVYVDKTEIAYNLITQGSHYFLSRPRRFGKSLFLDTLKCIFEGRKELFEGLFLDGKWDWEKKFPVIYLSFAEGVLKNRAELDRRLSGIFEENRKRLDISCKKQDDPTGHFIELIQNVHEHYGERVVILVDEYDKPILNNITNSAVALEMRDGLRSLYSVIKGQDAFVKFVFLTGVSKFSKMNLFSGLNNLLDLSLSMHASTICGYTQADVERHFREYLDDVDLKELKRWYNGYNFLGEPVYNPFDILLFFKEGKKYKNYWFSTGTPTFLMDMIRDKRFYVPDFDHIEVSEELLESFDVDNIQIESLMHQTGYLTIKEVKESRIFGVIRYLLAFPNFEVKYSFLSYLAGFLAGNVAQTAVIQDTIYGALEDGDIEQLKASLKRLFSSISYTNYTKNNLDQYEGYYASVVYAYLYSLGLPMTAEDTSCKGRADLTVRMPKKDRAYIFEFKVVEEANDTKRPLDQIKEKGYANKFRGEYEHVCLVGVEFSKKTRNITRFEWEMYAC